MAAAAGEAQSTLRIHDTAGKQQDGIGGEEIRVLHEEGPTLGILHLEPLVHRHLGFVRFHLGEVRVQGDVQHKGVIEDELGVHPQIIFRVGDKGRTTGSRPIEGVHVTGKGIGDDLGVVARRDIANAGEHGRLVQAPVPGDGIWRPEAFLAESGDLAPGLHPPHLVGSGGKAQPPQGHRDADHITLVGYLAVAVPDRFPGGIETRAVGEAFGPAGIPLHAQGRDPKGIGGALVIEGIDGQLHTVVPADVFPRGQIGADQGRIGIEGQEYGIKVALVIAQINLGSLGGRRAIDGLPLHETVDSGHLSGQRRGRRHAGKIAQTRFSAELGNDDVIGIVLSIGQRVNTRKHQ